MRVLLEFDGYSRETHRFIFASLFLSLSVKHCSEVGRLNIKRSHALCTYQSNQNISVGY